MNSNDSNDKRYMTYDGEGNEVGMLTIDAARERFESVKIENGCLTVARPLDTVVELEAHLADLEARDRGGK